MIAEHRPTARAEHPSWRARSLYLTRRFVRRARDGAIAPATRRAGPGDLWIARRERDGGWRAPVPFAPAVNTVEFENCPVWSPDGRTLYFVRGVARLYRLPITELPGAETTSDPNAAKPYRAPTLSRRSLTQDVGLSIGAVSPAPQSPSHKQRRK